MQIMLKQHVVNCKNTFKIQLKAHVNCITRTFNNYYSINIRNNNCMNQVEVEYNLHLCKYTS